MKRRKGTLACVGILLLALVLAPPPVMADGTVVVTVSNFRQVTDVTKYSIAWTSTAGGAVSGNALGIQRGWIFQAQFIPGAGGTQPTDLYDVVLNDAAGVDFLIGAGANLSNVTSKLPTIWPHLYYDGTAPLDLVISNAGASKTGTFVLWVRR